MHFNPPRKWFGAKKVGWGIGPHSWEGWVVTALIAVALITLSTTVF
ncbi:hypothetical protein QMK17_15750 [Rhodococcus sp. G-MC3]|nr:hypothetical protein [Rhodococcus sp. G-MC3]MDJ0394778.1 hypothetical protein [Rhodococcus sp. G-MC3]